MQSVTVRNTSPQAIETSRKTQSIGVQNAYQIVSVYDRYEGDYVVEPDFHNQVLSTKGRVMIGDVTVLKIRVAKTTNEYGTTVYIGKSGVV